MLNKSTPRPLRAGLFAPLLVALMLLVACGGPLKRADLQGQDRGAQGVEPTVLVVNLTGKLGTVELARCHRTLREAHARGCQVVFRLQDAGAQGETGSDLQSLFDHLQNVQGEQGVHTIAVLAGRVTHGAAALALLTNTTYCLRGTSWGEIEKPDKSYDELVSVDPDSAYAARLDALREQMKGRLERRKNQLRPDAQRLAMAMVDPRVQLYSATIREGGLERPRVLDQQELASLRDSGAAVFNEQPLTRPLFVTAELAEEYGLSKGTLGGFDQLAEVEALDRDRMAELETNWAESMVGWLELLQPFLLIAGFLMLLVELKTPGTGLPGILGVVFLSLALFHSYLVGLAEITEILVFFLGLAAIAVEIFLLPGTVIFGLIGFLCLVLSLVLSRQSFVLPSNAIEEQILLTNLANLVFMFVVVAVLGWLMWRLLPHVPVFNRLMLPPPGSGQEPASNSAPSQLGLTYDKLMALVGRTGRAATTLRPTGAMEIDGDRIDVVTEGEYIEAGDGVRVLYVQGNRVVVAKDASGEAAAELRAGERGSVGLVVLLLALGLALIFAEVIFVSMGVIGFGAAGCLFGALFVAFQESTALGIGVSVFEAIAAPLVIWFSFKALPHTPFGRRLILTGPPTTGSKAAADARIEELLGKRGVTMGTLRPTGYARIDGKKVDVVTRGDLLPKDCAIVVLEVSGNRVVVGRAPEATAAVAAKPPVPAEPGDSSAAENA